ncbi:MAG TPA: efflux RND transporter periplasmic adaptor subunit [Thermoanaerobaculia bacterium]
MRALLFLVIALAATGCGRDRGGQAQTAAPPEVVLGPADTAVVVRGPIASGPSLSGTLAAKREATIRAQIAGSVLETYAEPGQPVGGGETLARLDTSSLQDAYASARAAVTNARNNLAVAQREEERQRVLAEAGAVADRNIETSRQQTVAARAGLAQAQAQLAAAEKQLGYTRVHAPFSGVVSEKQVSAGDVVQPGTALYTVVDPSSLDLEASIPAEEIGALEIGSPVEFTVTGYKRAFQGRITRINPTADPTTRQVRVYAEIPNTGNDLVGGLFAEGRVATELRTALTLPAEAIDRRMARPAVARVREGKVERVEVELGLTDEQEQRVEVRRGVQAGDVVLVGAAQEITPGTPVRLAPAVRQEAERLAHNL